MWMVLKRLSRCCVLMLMVLKCVDCDGFSLVLLELVIVVTFVVVLHLLLDLGAVDWRMWLLMVLEVVLGMFLWVLR